MAAKVVDLKARVRAARHSPSKELAIDVASGVTDRETAGWKLEAVAQDAAQQRGNKYSSSSSNVISSCSNQIDRHRPRLRPGLQEFVDDVVVGVTSRVTAVW